MCICEELGVSETEMYKIAEGIWSGYGYDGYLWSADRTVYADRVKKQRRNRAGRKDEGKHLQKDEEYAAKFQEINGSVYCKELKGVATGKILAPCDKCI